MYKFPCLYKIMGQSVYESRWMDEQITLKQYMKIKVQFKIIFLQNERKHMEKQITHNIYWTVNMWTLTIL